MHGVFLDELYRLAATSGRLDDVMTIAGTWPRCSSSCTPAAACNNRHIAVEPGQGCRPVPSRGVASSPGPTSQHLSSLALDVLSLPARWRGWHQWLWSRAAGIAGGT